MNTSSESDGVNILSDIANAVDTKLEEMKISKLDVEVIGIGVPGPISPDGTVLKCINLGWGIFNVEQQLARLLETHITDFHNCKIYPTSLDLFDNCQHAVWRLFFRHTALIFPEIQQVFLRQIALSVEKISCPLAYFQLSNKA